jgi:hypothetical protein
MSQRSRERAAAGDIRGRSRMSLRSCGLQAAKISPLRKLSLDDTTAARRSIARTVLRYSEE